jgi:hypothetical protein
MRPGPNEVEVNRTMSVRTNNGRQRVAPAGVGPTTKDLGRVIATDTERGEQWHGVGHPGVTAVQGWVIELGETPCRGARLRAGEAPGCSGFDAIGTARVTLGDPSDGVKL